MEIIPNTAPAPRLTNTVEATVLRQNSAEAVSRSNVRLARTGLFSGNGRAIFVGLALGATLVSATAFLFSRHPATVAVPPVEPKMMPVETGIVSGGAHPLVDPKPVMMQVTEELLRVTAISLGHPRLAVINGTAVAEGDSIIVHSPEARSVTVKLRVLKIGDGRIDLTDGVQVIRTHLTIPALKVIAK